jgi:hypothetical protein
MHSRRALRCRRREHDAPKDIGANECDLLRDEAADREAEEIYPPEAHRVDKGDRTTGHRLNGVRSRFAGGTEADVVKQHDTLIRGQRVDERGIPVIEVPTEVLQQDVGDVTVTETAIRALDPILRLDSLGPGLCVACRRVGRHCLVRAGHSCSLSLVPSV